MAVLDTIIPQDFKDLFIRDFKYLPVWSALSTYNANDKVYYTTTKLFYVCINNNTTSVPTTLTDWTQVQDNIFNYISDDDISKAYKEALATFNQSLYGTNDVIKLVYLYLSAHYLVDDIRAGGLQSSSLAILNSKAVGNVSAGYTVPEWVLKSEILGFYTTTSYGRKYLNMSLPKLVGNIVSVYGGTNP